MSRLRKRAEKICTGVLLEIFKRPINIGGLDRRINAGAIERAPIVDRIESELSILMRVRKVEVYDYKRDDRGDVSKELKGIAQFHQWGSDYEYFEYGSGNYSTAIVEWPDGTVENVPCELVRFVDSLEGAATEQGNNDG